MVYDDETVASAESFTTILVKHDSKNSQTDRISCTGRLFLEWDFFTLLAIDGAVSPIHGSSFIEDCYLPKGF